MNERAVAARREYFREYARTHRKELRAAQERYWMRRLNAWSRRNSNGGRKRGKAAMPQNRTKTGTFAPGTSGNPGGRPKRTDAQKAAQEAIQALAGEAAELLAAIMRDATAPLPTRLKAAEMVLDRAIGKPMPGLEVKKQQENDAFAAKFGLGRAFGLDDD